MSKCLQVQYNGINSDAEFKEFKPFSNLRRSSNMVGPTWNCFKI